jgi:prepilin-type N-terminal cleavage/methylation domain-containing protein
MKLPNIKNIKGFTLIELLVVIGILAILLSIVLIAINPARQFGQANNTRRRSEVTQILNAIGAYAADHKGLLPAAIEGLGANVVTEIGSNAGQADICGDLVPNYIPALPVDPQVSYDGTVASGTPVSTCPVAGDYETGYQVSHDVAAGGDGRVTVDANLNAENEEIIANTR